MTWVWRAGRGASQEPRAKAGPGRRLDVISLRPVFQQRLSAPISGIAIINRKYDTFTNEIDLVKLSI